MLWAAAGQDVPAPDIPQLMQTGDAAYLKGDYEAARQTFDQARQLAELKPADDPVRYDIFRRLSSVRAAAGDFADADNFLQMAITWRENTQGQNDPKLAGDYLQSVTYCRGMKDFSRALTVLNRVLAMHAKASGYESTDVADDYSRMAQIYMEQKKPDLAIGALNNALAVRTKISGPLHPSLVYDFDRLGEAAIVIRDYAKAEAAYRRALVIRETLYGKNHADLIATLDGLAYACFGQKKYEEAEPIYQRFISLWVTSVGEDHPMLAIALDKVAVFYVDQKKYEQAKDAMDRATAIRTHFLATGLSVAATEQIGEGNPDAAKALYRRAAAVMEQPNPVYDELKANTEAMLKTMERLGPKKAAPKKK